MANRLPASESVTFPHQAPDPLPHRPHEAVGRVRGPDGGTPLETLSLALSHAFTSSTLPYGFQSTSVHVANTAGAMRAASSWSLRHHDAHPESANRSHTDGCGSEEVPSLHPAAYCTFEELGTPMTLFNIA